MSFGAIIGAVGGLLGNAQQSSNIDKSISAQQQENQKNREYNFWLAKQQNDWNLQQWQRENEYNSPSAQMARFRQAGLNPDLMMSNGAQNLSAQSPQMTSGSPSSPADLSALSQKPTFASVVNSALQGAVTSATVGKTNNEAEKIGNDIYWQDLINAQNIKLGVINLELGSQNVAKTKAEAEKLLQEVKNLQATWTETWANIRKLTAEERKIKAEKIGQDLKNRLTQKELDHYEEVFGWRREEAMKNLELISSQIAMNGSVTYYNNQMAYQVEFNNGILNLTRLTDEDYKSIATRDHTIRMAGFDVQEATLKSDQTSQQNRQSVENAYHENTFLLGVKETLGVVGQVFGGSIGYNVVNSNSTSHSTSHVTSRSSSHNTNVNYRGN